ncbi:hypothetical protein KIH74_21195 [Kineosporia sp. J2-2]|uniref:Uncharacterized protein n=1 Tax=Kineosporia corallincola TaxID=2835133 RepID=A0ABS5TK41_9ACTN|nr:hypothetical protein [Kineosporia corallincola]MBT0771467.1 hypothetical protein [Kineosporia corallincola]
MPARFHTAPELLGEVGAAGFAGAGVFGVEGPAWPAADVSGRQDLGAALRCARLVEQDPAMIHASAHLLAFAHRL